MPELKYPFPACLQDRLTPEQYRNWLKRKAGGLVRRDRGRGNRIATVSIYKEAIHQALLRDGADDWYTGEHVDWHLVLTYDNDASQAAGRCEKARLARLPTIDHEDDGLGSPRFRICGWAVNDAKNDLSHEAFVSLCHRVVTHAQKAKSPETPEAASVSQGQAHE